jgi:hypothetical protein
VNQRPTQQQEAGQLGGLTRWNAATKDQRVAQGRRGQKGLRQRFVRELAAEGVTEGPELAYRLALRLKLHYARMRSARRRAS